LQRRDQLGFEKRRPPRIIGQRRQRPDHAFAAAKRAIGAFQTPDGGDDRGVDAVAFFDLGQQIAVSGERGLTVADPVVRGGAVQILPYLFGEFGLIASFLTTEAL